MKLKKGDSVVVLAGKYKGKTGTIQSTTADNKVVVEGINVVKRHQKQQSKRNPAGVYEKTMPIDASNVGIAHPSKKGKTSRIGIKQDKKDKKVRVYTQAGGKEIK